MQSFHPANRGRSGRGRGSGRFNQKRWSPNGKEERLMWVEKHRDDQSSPEPTSSVVTEAKSPNPLLHSSERKARIGKNAAEFTANYTTLKSDDMDSSTKPNGLNRLSDIGDKSFTPSPIRESDKKPENSEQSGVFDICMCETGLVILKPSLRDINRELRNEMQCIVEAHNGIVLRPGMVLLKSYISISKQVKIVKRCRELGIGPGGFYRPGYSNGSKLRLNMMCLGKNWDPETGRYDDHMPNDGAKPPLIPSEFHHLVENAIKDSHSAIEREKNGCNTTKLLPWMKPDICLANFYSTTGRLGLHQDRDESRESIRAGLPVVSFSIGDSAVFLYGDARDVEEADEVVLESGDVLIFGGPSRNVFHGVAEIHANTAPKILLDRSNLRPGRLNLTFRQY